MRAPALDLSELQAIPFVEPDLGFDLSSDGEKVAFSWNATGQWEIYTVELVDSGTPSQLTSGPGAKFAPRWSPDGQRLAYALDLDGGEDYDIFYVDLVTGQHVNLTPETPEAILTSFAWSPDGSRMAFLSDRDGRFDTYIMASQGGEPYQVLSLPYPDWEVEWSPDGQWLAITSEGPGQDYWTFVVPVERSGSGTLTRRGNDMRRWDQPLGNEAGPICAKDACWSPDSMNVAFASNLRGTYDIGLYELETGQISWAMEGTEDCEAPRWSPDGVQLAFVINHGPVSEIGVLDLVSGKAKTFSIKSGVSYKARFTPDGTHLLVVFDNPRNPCDLWQITISDGSTRQLTQSMPGTLNRGQLHMPRTVRYPGMDGQEVPALLYEPVRASDSPPAVIYVHGGPNWLTQFTWDPVVQHMVSRGWVVLAPNYRGSTGYGRDWQLASRFDLGGIDTRDVAAGAGYLAANKLADPKRIAITGRSWGGYLTMTCLTRYPELWAAGSAVVPFLNWFTSHANSREDLQHWDRENFGSPEEDHDLWFEHSPFFFLEKITEPVQLICGANDVRCPASESVQARDRLEALGISCDLALYEDEGHGFLKIENRIDSEERRIAFLAKHLE